MANRPLCIISADWHAQPYAWRSHPQIAGDSYVAIEALADLCLELKPQWLFALGDLFDIQRPDPVTVKTGPGAGRPDCQRRRPGRLYPGAARAARGAALAGPHWLR
jgi:hypothetical protein